MIIMSANNNSSTSISSGKEKSESSDIDEITPQTDADDENEQINEKSDVSSSDDNTIYILLQKIHEIDYNELIEKDVWVKNMKSYVHNYLKTNSPSYEDFIKVPKYLIDAPFEVPNTESNSDNSDNSNETDTYNEENYNILVEEYINSLISGDDRLLEFIKETSYYIIRIDIPNNDEEDEREQQAFDDFTACEQQYEHGLTPIASFCSKLILLSYAGAYLLMFSSLFINSNLPLIQINKNNSTSFTIDEL